MFARNNKGFTLIELLIVIAIIGILSSIVLVSLSSAREKAKVASFKATVHSVQTKALEACDSGTIDYTDGTGSFGTYPDAIDGTASATFDHGQDCGPASTNTFIAEIPSAQLGTPCVAVVEETGITSFSGC